MRDDARDAGSTNDITGNAALSDLHHLRRVGFIHDGRAFHYFAMPGQRSTVIVGLSPDAKTAIGWTALTDDEATSPAGTFVLDVASSTFTPTNPTEQSWAVARGTSLDLRYVAGIAGTDAGPSVGFLWDRTSQAVHVITQSGCESGTGASRANDNGDLLVYCFVQPDYHINAWFVAGSAAPVPLVPPGTTASSNVSPLGINAQQAVVGLWSKTLAEPNHGFFAKRSSVGFDVTSYDIPGAYSTQLTGINDRGEIAGCYDDGEGSSLTHGPIFKLSDITAKPVVFDPGSGYRAQAWGISSTGWIHGYIELAQPISEPTGLDGGASSEGVDAGNAGLDAGEVGDANTPVDVVDLDAQLAELVGRVAVVDDLIHASSFFDASDADTPTDAGASSGAVTASLIELDTMTVAAAAALRRIEKLAAHSPPPADQLRVAIVDQLLIDLRRVGDSADALTAALAGAKTTSDTEQLTDNVQKVHFLSFSLEQQAGSLLTRFQEPTVRDFGIHLGPLNPRYLSDGNVLVAESSGDRVVEISPAGSVVWEYTHVAYPTAAEHLSNGNTLIADRDGQRAIEVTSEGTLVWEKDGLVGLYGVQRLDSGNTLLTVQGDYTEANPAEIVEVNSAGDLVWSFRGDSVGLLAPSAERLPNGNTLIGDNSGYFSGTARVIEVDPTGKVVWTFASGIYGVYGVLRLANGHTLINDQGNGRLIEVAPNGDIVWRYGGLDTPGGFDVLPSGDLLIADWSQNKLFEIGTH
ncbi:MAG TPA: hypothetical protein VHC69_21035 [Polyangiaceae bacterium]|nr:hypothetical protein [Polyangiaceae bacterium]